MCTSHVTLNIIMLSATKLYRRVGSKPATMPPFVCLSDNTQDRHSLKRKKGLNFPEADDISPTFLPQNFTNGKIMKDLVFDLMS